MTMGGNDLSNIAQKGASGDPLDGLWTQAEEAVQDLRDAVAWMVDPTNVPGGVLVVFANVYEYSDTTVDLLSCPAASTAGFDQNWENPQDLADLMFWLNEQYLDIAVQTGTDVVFMAEQFCGHGFFNEDPDNVCYRGAGAERWFDLTCIHPTPAGHEALAELFLLATGG